MNGAGEEMGQLRRHLREALAEIGAVKKVRDVPRVLDRAGNAALPERIALEHATAVGPNSRWVPS